MIELLGLFAFVAVGVFLVGAVAVGFVMLKLVAWFLFLPFRLLGWSLFLPFLLLKGLFGVLIGLVLLPIAVIGGVIAAVAIVAAVILPLVPLLILGLLVWAAVALVARPAAT